MENEENNLAEKAIRQLRKIKDAAVRIKISDAVGALKNFPNCQNVKKLVNHPYDYRLRVGNYRVFFTPELKIICIERVEKRDEATYKRPNY